MLQSSGELLSRANQAIATLERYKARLDEVSNALSALEIEDLATVRDAAIVSQRLEMVRRIADEVTGEVVELGTDGRLLALQLEELMAGVGRGSRADRPRLRPHRAARPLPAQVLDRTRRAVGYRPARSHPRRASDGVAEQRRGTGRGGQSARAPVARPRATGAGTILDRVVEHFGGLQKLLAASVEDLQIVDGVGETRARALREAISRLAEVSIIDRY